MLPEFLEEASTALERRIGEADLAPISESDEILRAFEARMMKLKLVGKSSVLDAVINNGVALVRQADVLQKNAPNAEVVLFRAQSKWCGAIRSSAHEVLSHLTRLVSLDQEDVIACSKNLSLGIFCSLDSREDSQPPVYHLVFWTDQAGGTSPLRQSDEVSS
jgi:hypothetical protein